MNEQGRMVALVVQEHYDDGNPEHHLHINEADKDKEEARDLDIIEIIRNPISKTETETEAPAGQVHSPCMRYSPGIESSKR